MPARRRAAQKASAVAIVVRSRSDDAPTGGGKEGIKRAECAREQASRVRRAVAADSPTLPEEGAAETFRLAQRRSQHDTHRHHVRQPARPSPATAGERAKAQRRADAIAVLKCARAEWQQEGGGEAFCAIAGSEQRPMRHDDAQRRASAAQRARTGAREFPRRRNAFPLSCLHSSPGRLRRLPPPPATDHRAGECQQEGETRAAVFVEFRRGENENERRQRKRECLMSRWQARRITTADTSGELMPRNAVAAKTAPLFRGRRSVAASATLRIFAHGEGE